MDQHPHHTRLERLDRLARRMDRAFRIPGTGIRIGYDSLLGLIPGVGDVAAAAPAAWIVMESHRMGAPRSLLARQVGNILIDVGFGAVPLIGDIFDVGYKANMRNVNLLRGHFDAQLRAGTSAGDGALASHHPTIEGTVDRSAKG